MTHTIEKTLIVAATPIKIWDYLTKADRLAIWFHKPAAPLAQGDYEMFGTESGERLMWGTVLVIEPHKRLEYSFTIAPMGDATSTVKWALTEVAGGTQLSLRHEGLPQGADAFGLTLALDDGWDKHLARMRTSIQG